MKTAACAADFLKFGKILVKPEIHLNRNQHVDGFSVFNGWLKTPLLYRLDGLFIRAEAEGIRYLDVMRKTVRSYDH